MSSLELNQDDAADIVSATPARRPGGQSVTLTDTLGHTINGTIPTSSGGSIGAQFPMVCQ